MSNPHAVPSKPPLAAEEEEEEEEEEQEQGRSRLSEAIEAQLLESRTILVEGPVTDRMFRHVSSRLLYLEHKDPKAEVWMVVNSPGGGADTGFGIYDLMGFVSCPIRTLCAGLCASAAILIFLGGRKGWRYALPNARFLLHQPSTTTYGPASDMEITAKEILRLRQRYAEVVAQEIGAAAEKIIQSSNRDFWLNAEESLKFGLVDKIVPSRQDL